MTVSKKPPTGGIILEATVLRTPGRRADYPVGVRSTCSIIELGWGIRRSVSIRSENAKYPSLWRQQPQPREHKTPGGWVKGVTDSAITTFPEW